MSWPPYLVLPGDEYQALVVRRRLWWQFWKPKRWSEWVTATVPPPETINCRCTIVQPEPDGPLSGTRADTLIIDDPWPDGVFEKGGDLFFTCLSCGQAARLECDLDEFDPTVAYCGGSPRCCP